MSNKTAKDDANIEIHIDADIMKGTFANVTNIGHTKEEFLLDFLFIQQTPAPFGKLVSRVIVTPAHAKRLLFTLSENIQKYENEYGKLDDIHPVLNNRTLQ